MKNAIRSVNQPPIYNPKRITELPIPDISQDPRILFKPEEKNRRSGPQLQSTAGTATASQASTSNSGGIASNDDLNLDTEDAADGYEITGFMTDDELAIMEISDPNITEAATRVDDESTVNGMPTEIHLLIILFM